MEVTGRRPLVGLSTRRWPASALGSALPPTYAGAGVDLGIADYPAAIAAGGGLPVHLVPDAPAGELVACLDALVLTGGADVDPGTRVAVPPARPERGGARSSGTGSPARGGPGGPDGRGGPLLAPDGGPGGSDASWEPQLPEPGSTEPQRDRWELALLRAALELDLPVLAVCRGLQLLNVAHGGTLVDDLPAGDGDGHARFAGPRGERVHEVALDPGSLAASVYGTSLRVNSLHHQAVDRPGDGLVVVGRSPDGTVEALEIPGRAVLAVQWHPEALAGDPAPEWLVAAARERMAGGDRVMPRA